MLLCKRPTLGIATAAPARLLTHYNRKAHATIEGIGKNAMTEGKRQGCHSRHMGAMTAASFISNTLLSRGLRPQRRLLCSLHRHVTRPTCTTSRVQTDVATASAPHAPVLVDEIVSHFSGRRLDTFVDGTVGAGGHALELLLRCDIGQYIGIDKDMSALSISESRLCGHDNVTLLHGDFRDMPSLLSSTNVSTGNVDGILLDVGVSSMQLDQASRGFSFTKDGPLDMRMSGGADGAPSAAELVNGASAATLERVFREYGEERQARRIATAVVAAREQASIETTGRLADVICSVKGWSKRGVHPATLCFQALRIAVNGELEALEIGVPSAVGMLKGGGRLAVVCFHSLEDRIAKMCFKGMAEAEEGGVGLVNKKPIVAGEEECRRNVRSRSAKLRVVQKLEEGEVPWGRKVNKYKREEMR